MTNSPEIQHPVLEQLSAYAQFYDHLSFSIMQFVSMGTGSVINIDTHVYSSMQGTLESMRDILKKGHINDAYALLRKYYDAATINIYTNLYLEDNFSIDNFVVEKIQNWIKGKEQLPRIQIMNNYLQRSEKVSEIYNLLHKDKRYSDLRERCNDHTHYNFYHNVLQNNSEMFMQKINHHLDKFSNDTENIFIYHLAYLFYLKDMYMMGSDYLDSLECGVTPEPNSQYWVAPFVQDIFDTVIKIKRPDLALAIKSKTVMSLS